MKKIIYLLLLVCSHVLIADCAFCRQDVIDTQVVFENAHFRIFLDYAPRVPGHLLVVPKNHVLTAENLSENQWREFTLLVPKIVNVFRTCLGTDNYLILQKNGCYAFQSVPHVHFHFMPVHNEKWSEIFRLNPERMDQTELEEKIKTFRNYFLENR